MKRSKHSLSHYNLLSCNMGSLVPVGLTEVLPGDTMQHASSVLTRVSPLLAPIMHPVHVRLHHWFVPHRLVWDDWEEFITGGPDGDNSSTFPTITLSTTGTPASADIGNLADYLGCPPEINGLEVSALPFRAYAMIFNEFYRDEDLVTELSIDTTSGADSTTNTDVQNVAWEKDYFTSSRPWTQKGPEVTLPLSGDAPISGFGLQSPPGGTSAGTIVETDGSGTRSVTGWGSGGMFVEEDPNNSGYPNMRADLQSATGASINDVRLAFALQRYQEARARYGSRYTEYLRYLNVKSSDARLQRPEYLGGGRQTIQFSEVLQTAEGTDPVGELRGHGISAVRTNRYRRFFEEHGYVISMLSVLPKTVYVQGLHRTFNRRTKEDFWQKELEHIGQQEVANKEVYAAHSTPDGTFGYQDRYDEYRRTPSRVSGEFRDTALDFWHYGRIFSADPALNSDFVTANPTDRVYAAATNDVLWMMVNHSIQARRLISSKGTSYTF